MDEEFDELITLVVNNIKYYRKKKGLTRKELSSLADISISYMPKIERKEFNEQGTGLAVLIKIAYVFGIPVYKLFEEIDYDEE